jgi:hypothetical protein
MKKRDYFNKKAWAIIGNLDGPWDEQTQREYSKVVEEYQEWRSEVQRKRNAFHPKCGCRRCFREFNSNMFIRSKPFLCRQAHPIKQNNRRTARMRRSKSGPSKLALGMRVVIWLPERLTYKPFSVFSSKKLITSKFSYSSMNTITILTLLAILAGATLSITGFSVTISVVAQMTADNATMGNMSGGNMSGGNMTGSIVDCGPTQGQTC